MGCQGSFLYQIRNPYFVINAAGAGLVCLSDLSVCLPCPSVGPLVPRTSVLVTAPGPPTPRSWGPELSVWTLEVFLSGVSR